MPRWEKEDTQVHVSHLFGNWGPSRAVNPSMGDDPISLGMFSGQGAPAPVLIGPPPPPAAEPSPTAAPPSPQQPAIPTEAAPPPEPMRNMLLLDDGRVHLNGRFISLNVDQLAEVMRLVMDAYEQQLRDEVATLRLEFNLLPTQRTGPQMQAPSDMGQAVRPLPRVDPESLPEVQGQPTAADLQQMLLAEAAQRGLPVVQGKKARSRATTSKSRHAVPRPDAPPTP